MLKKPILSGKSTLLPALVFGALLGAASLFPVKPVLAACHYDGPGQCLTYIATELWWNPPGSSAPWQELKGVTFDPDFSPAMKDHLTTYVYSNLIVKKWWETQFDPALRQWVSQLTAHDSKNATAQAAMTDAMLAAKAEQVKQALALKAQSELTPDESFGRIVDIARSLAASDTRVIGTANALSSLAQSRETGKRGTKSASGADADREARFKQFQDTYCNPMNNNGELVCNKTAEARFNKDISYTRTVDTNKTLILDYTSDDKNIIASKDSQDVQALSAYLYGHDVPLRLTGTTLKNETEKARFSQLRQLSAFRNTARNSFNIAVGMRALGDQTVATTLGSMQQALGMTAEQASNILSQGTGRPSYYAQMESLTKTLYQNPDFYNKASALKPAGLDRLIASTQAIGLMQDRDIYESLERQEMMLSLLLELRTRTEQAAVVKEVAAKGK